MNPCRRAPLAVLLLVIFAAAAYARAPLPASPTPVAAASAASDPAARPADEDWQNHDDRDGDDEEGHFPWRGGFAGDHEHHHDLVNIGRGSDLPAGEHADAVVSVFGSSTSAGDASDVVSVFGDTRVSGPVRHAAIAVGGDTYVDSPVDGDVVAVGGSVRLGPNARVGGNVIAVGGSVQRDPAATVQGRVQTVGGELAGLGGLKRWIQECLFYGRPLAFAPGLGWAWGIALALLAIYVGLALLFREGVTRCVHTLESEPGMTLLAALLTALATPVAIVLLCITFVGIVAIPFVAVALLCASLFGKTVMLAWLGQRVLGARAAGRLGHPAAAVLIGGSIVLLLYVVPVLGLVVYKLLGLFGIGAVVYTLVRHARERRAELSAGAAPGAGPAPAAAPATAAGPAPAMAPQAPPPGAAPEAAARVPMASLPRAGFWIRMAALLLDALLIGVLMGVLHDRHLHLVVLAVYGAIMWKLRGATVGGIVFDLQVVRLDDRPVDWETAIVRALSCFLSLFVVGLGFFWIAFDHGKQAWHDKIAGTAVVRVPRAASR